MDDEPASYNNLGKDTQDEKGETSLEYYVAYQKPQMQTCNIIRKFLARKWQMALNVKERCLE